MEWTAAEQAAGSITFAVKLAYEDSSAVLNPQQFVRSAEYGMRQATALL